MARYRIMNSLLAAVLLVALLPSCNLLKPATDPNKDKVYKDEEVGEIQGGKVYDPETGTWRTVNTVDTAGLASADCSTTSRSPSSSPQPTRVARATIVGRTPGITAAPGR